MVFSPPSEQFVAKANVSGMDAYRALYERANEKPEEFWGELAEKEVFWFKKWDHVFEWHPPFAKWFVGAETNMSYNCLDRHLEKRGNKYAIIWEGEPGDERKITYSGLHKLVCTFANVLKKQGYKAGDRAIIYMPMVPEVAVAMLACTRLGITHSVVFGGFSAEALKARIQDLGATLVITADGGWLAARQGSRTEVGGRRSARGMPRCHERDRLSAARLGGRHEGGTRSLVARAREGGRHGVRRGPARCGASAVSLSILPEPPGNPKAFCTRPAVTFSTPR